MNRQIIRELAAQIKSFACGRPRSLSIHCTSMVLQLLLLLLLLAGSAFFSGSESASSPERYELARISKSRSGAHAGRADAETPAVAAHADDRQRHDNMFIFALACRCFGAWARRR